MRKGVSLWRCVAAMALTMACGHKNMIVSDSVQLLPASVQQLPEIVAAVQERAPTRISVVGHSDTMGDKAYNLDLSQRRAAAVKQQLMDRGLDDTFMDVSSHGEENPLVKTADNAANAENRRVEVIVR